MLGLATLQPLTVSLTILRQQLLFWIIPFLATGTQTLSFTLEERDKDNQNDYKPFHFYMYSGDALK